MNNKLTRRGSISVLTVTGAPVAVGVGYAAIPAADGVIRACCNTLANPSGVLRLIDTEAGAKCAKNEKQLDCNQRGPKGDKGDPGPEIEGALDVGNDGSFRRGLVEELPAHLPPRPQKARPATARTTRPGTASAARSPHSQLTTPRGRQA